MKGLNIAFYAVCLAASLAVSRADDSSASTTPKDQGSTTLPKEHKPEHKRPPLTEEQKALRKELLGKYDTNKDGKLDKEERKNVSDADKAKLKKAGLVQGKSKPVKKS